VVASTSIRSDTAFAFMQTGGKEGFTTASMLSASFQVVKGLAPLVRLGFVGNLPPSTPAVMGMPPPPGGGVALVNPAVGATYSLELPAYLRLAFFLGVTVPIGMGGGDTPNPAQLAATKAGAFARSSMDNSMFSIDDFTIFPGLDFAFIFHGLTVQIEGTLFQLFRVRGGDPGPPDKTGKPTPAKDPDAMKTNFTTGVHVGYFFVPVFSLGAELRYQTFLSTPVAVAKTSALRDNLSVAGGPRFHIRLGESAWFRPGVAYARGLRGTLSTNDYNIVQLDLPFVF
jgi:hypothetical protein